MRARDDHGRRGSILNDAGHGTSGINEGDIIPVFTIDGITYPGHNTQLLGTQGCRLPALPPDYNNFSFVAVSVTGRESSSSSRPVAYFLLTAASR